MYIEMPDNVVNVVNTNPVASAVNRRSQLEQKSYQECLENLVIALNEQVNIQQERLENIQQKKIRVTRVDEDITVCKEEMIQLITLWQGWYLDGCGNKKEIVQSESDLKEMIEFIKKLS